MFGEGLKGTVWLFEHSQRNRILQLAAMKQQQGKDSSSLLLAFGGTVKDL